MHGGMDGWVNGWIDGWMDWKRRRIFVPSIHQLFTSPVCDQSSRDLGLLSTLFLLNVFHDHLSASLSDDISIHHLLFYFFSFLVVIFVAIDAIVVADVVVIASAGASFTHIRRRTMIRRRRRRKRSKALRSRAVRKFRPLALSPSYQSDVLKAFDWEK